MVVNRKYWWRLKNDNWTSREYRQRLVDWDVYEFGAHLGHTWGKIDHQAVYRLAQALLDSGMAVIITNIFLDLPFFKPCPTPFYHEPIAFLKAHNSSHGTEQGLLRLLCTQPHRKYQSHVHNSLLRTHQFVLVPKLPLHDQNRQKKIKATNWPWLRRSLPYRANC